MIDISKITKEIARKRQILADFEASMPADEAYWKGWKMAESIAQHRDLTSPPTKTHAEQILRENIRWLEQNKHTAPNARHIKKTAHVK